MQDLHDVYIGVVVNLVVLTAIGVGPSLSLLGACRRLEAAVLIAPCVGLSLTAVAATYLVILDQPVGAWARTWLVVAVVASLALCLAQRGRLTRARHTASRRLLLAYAAALAVSTVLALLPLYAGGLSFMILRGNGTDTFNYLTLAGYLDHEPYSWAARESPQTLIQANPLYALAQELLFTRWTTSAVLAWSSDIASVQPYRFAYGFSVLSLLASLGPALLLVWTAGVGVRLATLIAIAASVGFWPQFVLDMQAISQINSIPITLVIAFLAARLFGSDVFTAGETLLVCLMLTALTLLYVEMLPTVLAGLGLMVALTLSRRRATLLRFGRLAAAGVGALVLLAPDGSQLGAFLRFQLESAADRPNDWAQAYFSWLYQNPLVGTWGMSYLAPTNQLTPRLLFATALALGMSALLGLGVVHVVRRRGEDGGLLALTCLTAAALAEFVFLYARGGLWAAGKAVAFAYPFLILAACTLPARLGTFRLARSRVLGWGAAGLVLVWACLQVGLGVQRVRLAATGIDPPNYVNNHGSYRHHDWDLTSIRQVILSEKPASVWVMSSDPWLLQFLELALSWDTRLIEPAGVHRRDDGQLVGFQSVVEPAPFVLIPKDDWWNPEQMPGALAAQNAEFALVRTTGRGDQQPLVALGSRDASGIHVALVSPAAGQAIISTDGRADVSVPVAQGLTTLTFDPQGASAPVAGLHAILKLTNPGCRTSSSALCVGSPQPAPGG